MNFHLVICVLIPAICIQKASGREWEWRADLEKEGTSSTGTHETTAGFSCLEVGSIPVNDCLQVRHT